MSKSKKNTKKSNTQNGADSARNCENNMSYATDKKPDHTTDCHGAQAQDKNESNCR